MSARPHIFSNEWHFFARIFTWIGTFIVVAPAVAGPVHYVMPENPNPIAPFLSWENAATNIQEALDVATAPGATVLVTDGVYRLTCELVVSNPVVLVSVNGPAVTIIDGQYPAVTSRCVLLAHSNSTLSGFTITRGYSTNEGGGVRASYFDGGTVSNCVITENRARQGGGAAGGVIRNSIISSNQAWQGGGGTHRGTIIQSLVISNTATAGGAGGSNSPDLMEGCTVIGNTALGSSGGGVVNGTVRDSLIIGNYCDGAGGGAYGGTITRCLVVSNRAVSSGGGIYAGNSRQCLIAFNTSYVGGGVQGGNLYNCVVMQNIADGEGGGARTCNILNSTVVSNRAGVGGGTAQGYAHNTIIYFNHADSVGSNYYLSSTVNCLTAPGGFVTNPPQFDFTVDGLPRLMPGSPAIDAGAVPVPAFYDGSDYDGISRPLDGNHDGTNRWDIGAFEYIHPVADSDDDGMRDQVEAWCGSDATNRWRHLRLEAGEADSAGRLIRWQSEPGKTYRLERGSDPLMGFNAVVGSAIPATPPTNELLDASVGAGPWVYRVMLEDAP